MMETSNISLDNPVVRSLACAAISPGLRSILVFDVTLETFEWLAKILTRMLEITTGSQVIQFPLSVNTTETDLWGNPTLSHEANTTTFVWQPGILIGTYPDNSAAFRLITIPDLTSLNLITKRACVMMMGHDAFYLERYGRHEQFHPQICWLARCKSSEVGQISSHLLDRFSLRLRVSLKPANKQDRVSNIQKWVNNPTPKEEVQIPFTPELENQLSRALEVYPHLSHSVSETVCSYFKSVISPGCRREISLARLAIACARLSGDKTVNNEHVHQAARILGLQLHESKNVNREEGEQKKPQRPTEQTEPHQDSSQKRQVRTSTSQTVSDKKTPVYASDTSTTLPATELIISGPYPEDSAPIEHEAYTLQLPTYHRSKTINDRGPIIGVQPTENPYDLAITATLFEASKYQQIRRTHNKIINQSMLIHKSDLRRYRRAPIPEQLLALLIDYTALKKSNWQEIVLPYIQWAYIKRANLCLVKVGAADAIHELRAERIVAHSVLNPHITQALHTPSGQATPLAHGFDLAFQTLRHALQHGRGTVREALLIILTDGRGNIPLNSSQIGVISYQVKREGVNDTIEIAKRIHSLENLQTMLYTPQLDTYPELPFDIADALGCKVFEIPRIQEVTG